MGKLKYLVAAALAATGFAGSANAAQTLIISGPSGIYGDDDVTCGTAPTPCSFTRTFTFATPAGFNQVSLDISSILSSATTDINFSSVTFNGVNYNTVLTGMQEFRNLLMQSLRTDGSLNTIVVTGTTGGNAAFSGNLSFTQGAVPEPGTWGLMLLGFAGAGWSLRRNRRRDSMLMQAA